MKKIVMLMLSLLLMFSFTACGGGGGDSESTKSEKSDPNVMQIGDYKAEFKGYEIVKDSNEDDAIVVTWEYTNNGEEAKSFTWAFDYALTQDGEKLENSTMFVKDTYDAVDDAMGTDVEPGKSLEVKTTGKLRNLKTPVKAEFANLAGDETDSMEIDITK